MWICYRCANCGGPPNDSFEFIKECTCEGYVPSAAYLVFRRKHDIGIPTAVFWDHVDGYDLSALDIESGPRE